MEQIHPLETYRKTNALSRGEFAQRLGISASYMTRLLKQQRKPSGMLAAKIEVATDGKVPAKTFFEVGQ